MRVITGKDGQVNKEWPMQPQHEGTQPSPRNLEQRAREVLRLHGFLGAAMAFLNVRVQGEHWSNCNHARTNHEQRSSNRVRVHWMKGNEDGLVHLHFCIGTRRLGKRCGVTARSQLSRVPFRDKSAMAGFSALFREGRL